VYDNCRHDGAEVVVYQPNERRQYIKATEFPEHQVMAFYGSEVVLQNVESGVRGLCCPTRCQVPRSEVWDPGLNTIQSILSMLKGQPMLRFFGREQQVLS